MSLSREWKLALGRWRIIAYCLIPLFIIKIGYTSR